MSRAAKDKALTLIKGLSKDLKEPLKTPKRRLVRTHLGSDLLGSYCRVSRSENNLDKLVLDSELPETEKEIIEVMADFDKNKFKDSLKNLIISFDGSREELRRFLDSVEAAFSDLPETANVEELLKFVVNKYVPASLYNKISSKTFSSVEDLRRILFNSISTNDSLMTVQSKLRSLRQMGSESSESFAIRITAYEDDLRGAFLRNNFETATVDSLVNRYLFDAFLQGLKPNLNILLCARDVDSIDEALSVLERIEGNLNCNKLSMDSLERSVKDINVANRRVHFNAPQRNNYVDNYRQFSPQENPRQWNGYPRSQNNRDFRQNVRQDNNYFNQRPRQNFDRGFGYSGEGRSQDFRQWRDPRDALPRENFVRRNNYPSEPPRYFNQNQRNYSQGPQMNAPNSPQRNFVQESRNVQNFRNGNSSQDHNRNVPISQNERSNREHQFRSDNAQRLRSKSVENEAFQSKN